MMDHTQHEGPYLTHNDNVMDVAVRAARLPGRDLAEAHELQRRHVRVRLLEPWRGCPIFQVP